MIDSLGLRKALLDLPDQVKAASQRLSVTGDLPDHESIANILLVGTGAAGWACELLAAVAGPFLPVPVVVHHGFEPPSFVDPTTLVVAISASGQSPETVASASTCVEAGGQLFAVTSGGALGTLADQQAAPTIFLPVSDQPIPTRARIGALSVPVLRAFESMGLFPGASDWIGYAIEQLVARRAELTEPDNAAVTLARKLQGTIPLVYGGGEVGAVAADRWKVQLNQSAKTPAWTGKLPDVVHGEIAGWAQHGDITRQVMSLVLLRHDHEAPEIAEQFDRVVEWTAEVMSGIYTVQAAGEGALAQILDLGFFGDMVALELADRAGIDPGPTPTLAVSPG